MVVFVSTAAVIAYILVGYPLTVLLRRRLRPDPVAKDPSYRPTVSFVVPVHDGEHYLRDKLLSVLDVEYPRDKMEVIVVSDGSTDGTAAIAAGFAEAGVRLMDLPRGGKCAALNAGIADASGEVLILTDVRQPIEPGAVRALVANFADPRVGAVSGHLKIRDGQSSGEADIGLYWRFETWMRESLATIDSMFGATGPFYALRRALAVQLPEDILLDDMYLPLAAFRRGYRLVTEEEAVAWDYPTARATEFNRKVRTLAGNYQLMIRCPWLLGPRNRMWLDFVSYKVGRLLLPLLLVILLASAFAASDPLRAWLVGVQLLGYTLAVADVWIPDRWPVKSVTSPARTFLVMMVAAAKAWSIFFVPARTLWKVTSSGPVGALSGRAESEPPAGKQPP